MGLWKEFRGGCSEAMRLLEQELLGRSCTGNRGRIGISETTLATAMTIIDEYAMERKSDSTEDIWINCTRVGTTIYWAFDETIPVTMVSNSTISMERSETYSQHPQHSDSGSAGVSWGFPILL